jgi:hypothetical protein
MLFLKKLKVFRNFFLFLLIYGFTKFLYLFDSNSDGIIREISLYHLGTYTLCIGGFLLLIIECANSKIAILKNLSFSLFILAFFWIFLEIISWGLYKTKLIDFKKPTNSLLFLDVNEGQMDRKPYWGDYSPVSGKWRLPNDSLQKVRCNDSTLLIYKTNSIGARDKERSFKNNTNKKRVIFLGDSFIEGIMVNTKDRCSNILEKNTGNEHLNFGVNGTSPINYYLLYQSLAKKFDHDIVVIGVLPANDFQDYTEGKEISLLEYPIYRPYWKDANNKMELKYSLASVNQSYSSLAIYNKPYKIYHTKDSVYKTLSLVQKIKVQCNANSYILALVNEIASRKPTETDVQPSIFENYPKNNWKAFSYSLEKLFEEAKGKEIIVMTIPILKDIERYQKNHKNELASQLGDFCKKKGVNYIDLLPILSSHKNPSELFISCDGHWSEKGERNVAEILQNNISYQKTLR